MVSSLKELLDDPELAHIDDPEEKFVTSGVSWQMYEALLAKLEDNSHYRVTYWDGILEIVSPSIRYENIKKRLAIPSIVGLTSIAFMLLNAIAFIN